MYDTLSSKNYEQIKGRKELPVLSHLQVLFSWTVIFLINTGAWGAFTVPGLQQEWWRRGPQALQTKAVTSSHCLAQLMPCLLWQAPATLRHHTSASTKHTFEKVWATEGTSFRGCQGKPALSINSRGWKSPKAQRQERLLAMSAVILLLPVHGQGKIRHIKTPFARLKRV